MPVDQAELGRRIRTAREACGFTQEQLAEKLDVSRPTMAQIELGNRGVSSLELDRLAYFLAHDIRDFLADSFDRNEWVQALFRSQPETSNASFQNAIRDCVALGNELTDLEEELGLRQDSNVVTAFYPSASTGSGANAVRVAEQVAREERRRLGLGIAPIGDVVQLIEDQGIRTGSIPMPDDVSGLTITHPRVGLFVVVNANHAPQRRRFSWCHEYAHVLLDRAAGGLVSRAADRNSTVEVRANAFAANLLMPEEGVAHFLAGLGKEGAQRHLAIYDESEALPVLPRSEPGFQRIQLYDVVQLGHHFGVSRQSALYRLRNLRRISEPELAHLLERDAAGGGEEIAKALRLPPPPAVDEGESNRRFLGLGLEALRREKITRARFFELAHRAGVPPPMADMLLQQTGMGDASGGGSPLIPHLH